MTIQSRIITTLVDPTPKGANDRQILADNAAATGGIAIIGMVAWSILNLFEFFSAARSPTQRLFTVITGFVGGVVFADVFYMMSNIERMMKRDRNYSSLMAIACISPEILEKIITKDTSVLGPYFGKQIQKALQYPC